MEMKVSPNMPGRAWLRINRLVTVRCALNIMEMLENDHPVDRGGSGGKAAVQPGEG
jgi:hypothetical protein